MRIKEEILERKGISSSTKHHNYEYLFNNVLDAMQQYAEEYHQSELLKLNKSDVISSVCDCAVPSPDTDKYCCTICDKELAEDD